MVLRLGAVYFAIVFAVGFALGIVRTLWVVPALGERMAELVEMPFMLVVVTIAARTIVRRHAALRGEQWLAVGVVALALTLAIEFTAVLRMRDLSIPEYLATRDPVSGTVYYVLLGVFAVMPFFIAHWAQRKPR